MEISDFDLVKNCLAGNQEAFSVLVTRYKKLIYSVVYNMISDKQYVTDISQEVFLRIYKSLDRYNPEFKFSTWSVKITTNYCLDVLRKKKMDYIPIEEMTDVSSNVETPETQYINKEQSLRLREAVAELPDKYKILILSFSACLNLLKITSCILP